MTDYVLFKELEAAKGQKVGVVTLNAESTLNALDQGMVESIYETLSMWSVDDSVVCVFIDGQGEKAFCSGGDIRILRKRILEGDRDAPVRFFASEYRLSYLMHTYKKPIICWGNGYCMGAGVGLMAGAPFRVVTDTTVLSMPEVSIGLCPDAGGSWLLGRMPRNIGLFIALTSCRLNAGDAMYLGLANRFIDHAFRPNVVQALQTADWQGDHYDVVYRVMSQFAADSVGWLPYSKIRAHRDQITEIMDQPSLPAIIKQLHHLETDDIWLSEARDAALLSSPLSASIAFKQLDRSCHMSLKETFMHELVLVSELLFERRLKRRYTSKTTR